jgi:hypothetical protein
VHGEPLLALEEMVMASPTNTDDVIDSRDIIARIEELEAEFEAVCADAPDSYRTDEMAVWQADNQDELDALLALQNEAEGYAPDWKYGTALIRDSYFEHYAQELADDLHGKAMSDATWPFDCIDWERAARELRMDYSAAEFDGVTYWVRS